GDRRGTRLRRRLRGDRRVCAAGRARVLDRAALRGDAPPFRRLLRVRHRPVDQPAELRLDRRQPRPAADQGPDPATGVLRRLERADDLRRTRPAAARGLRARPRTAPGRAPARGRGRGGGSGGGAAAGHRATAAGRHPRRAQRPPRPGRAGDGPAAAGRRWLAWPEEADMSGVRNARPNGPVMILAGGTGGHIFPGLSVAHALQARGVPVCWLGADGGMETCLVPQHGVDIDTIPVKGLRGKGIGTLLAAPLRVLAAVRAALRVMRVRKPRAVVSFGGYAAGPGCLAARLLGIPLVVHEQNRAPGMTNRVLARLARGVLTGFPDTFRGLGEAPVGNPVRSEIAKLPPPEQRMATHNGAVRLLVLGGSQGARALNDAM